jgi:hypothetical protein
LNGLGGKNKQSPALDLEDKLGHSSSVDGISKTSKDGAGSNRIVNSPEFFISKLRKETERNVKHVDYCKHIRAEREAIVSRFKMAWEQSLEEM